MGLLDNVFGSGSGSAVPGGNVTKPLMIALLALLASRYMSGGSKEAPASARPDAPKLPDSMPDPSPGTIVGGLGAYSNSSSKRVLAKWPIPGSKPGRTMLSPPVRFRMHLVQTLSTPFPSAPASPRIRSCRFCPKSFPTRSTSSRHKGGCRRNRSWRG